jgi:hypothetical protein
MKDDGSDELIKQEAIEYRADRERRERINKVLPFKPEQQTSSGFDYGYQSERLAFIKIAEWQDQPVPERQWIVGDRIPAKNVTLLSGEGSIGKSILSLQLAVAVVLGKDWLCSLPDLGPVIAVCCEDDEDEIWRRLDLILAHYGASVLKYALRVCGLKCVGLK